jgi:hypothetical protein
VIAGCAVGVVVVIAAILRALPERLRPPVMRTEPVPAAVSIDSAADEVSDRDAAGESTRQKG